MRLLLRSKRETENSTFAKRNSSNLKYRYRWTFWKPRLFQVAASAENKLATSQYF